MAHHRELQDPPGQAAPGYLYRDHQEGRNRRHQVAAGHRHAPGRRPAGPPQHRPPGRLPGFPAGVAQDPLRALSRPGPEPGPPPRGGAGAGDRQVRRHRVLDAAGPARHPGRRGLHRHAGADRRHQDPHQDRQGVCRGPGQPHRGAGPGRGDRCGAGRCSLESRRRPHQGDPQGPVPAFHHLQLPDGCLPQARVRQPPGHGSGPASLRARLHHLHAYRLDLNELGGNLGRRRTGEAQLRRQVLGGPLQEPRQEGQGRPGSPRVHPSRPT